MILSFVRLFVLSMVMAGACCAQDPWKQPYGLVPDKETAIKIAEAVLFPLYGEDEIKKERPYKVELRDGVWELHGSMPTLKDSLVVGGTFYVKILQSDARVIDIGHYM
jgi:hypothetical protein